MAMTRSPPPTAGADEDVEVEHAHISAAQVHAPGGPTARGLALRSGGLESGPDGRS